MSNYDSMLKLKAKLEGKEETPTTEDISTVELTGDKFQNKNGETADNATADDDETGGGTSVPQNTNPADTETGSGTSVPPKATPAKKAKSANTTKA